MPRTAQLHYTVSSKDKKIMDEYTKRHHITNSKFLRDNFKKSIIKAKASIMTDKFDKFLDNQPSNDNQIKNDQDFNRWLQK